MNQKYKIATLILGIMTALVLVFSQLFWFQGISAARSIAQAEQQAADTEQEQGGTTDTYISQLSSPSTSSSSIVVEQNFSFIEEIAYEIEEVKQSISNTLVIRTGKLFETLFSAIISPNAP